MREVDLDEGASVAGGDGGAGDRGDGAALSRVVRRSLAGDPVGPVLDRFGEALDARRAGHRFVVVGTAPGARIHGRRIDLPRRVGTLLDRVVTGAESGRPVRHGAVVRVAGTTPSWEGVRAELVAVGLGLPVLVGLAAGRPLGFVAVFPELVTAAAPPEAPAGTDPAVVDDLDLTAWVDAAALVLAREHDRSSDRSLRSEELTGLPTSRLVAFLLRERLHRRQGRTLAVIHVGLDRLDRLDAAVGGIDADDLLRVAAARVRAAVRPEDLVGHARGDDLVVIGDGLDADGAGEVAERIRATLTEPLETDGERGVAVTPGVGFVVAGPDDTVDRVLHKAATAAREAAAAGGSAAVRYRPGSLEAARERVDIENDLRRALVDRGLTLAYQPQVSLVDGTVLGVEALVRWERAGQGPIAPETFIPVAEDTGLVVDLGMWAIDRALADLAAGLPVAASVNLSTRQLDEPSLLDDITAALTRHEVEPSRLRLEVTESSLARDPDRGEALLRRLHDLGVRVVIDDFGTGYAGLENLRRTEVADSVKIDRAFVTGVVDDPRDRAIVAAAVSLGRALGVTVVAEGVETEAQARVLAGLDCDAAQGFWFGPPAPLADLDLAPRPLP